jgi:hypothetical protein
MNKINCSDDELWLRGKLILGKSAFVSQKAMNNANMEDSPQWVLGCCRR